jgi:hypothetical protein
VKLRIRGNSIRLRLGRGEVRRLAEQGAVEERTVFGRGKAFVYCVRTEDVASVGASFDGTGITVRVPREVARRWAAGDEVGIEGAQPAGDGGPLKILIEKDFECVDAPADESQADAFPNPRAACAGADERE